MNTDYQAPVTKAEMQSAPQRRSQLSELPGPHHTATDHRKPAALMLSPKPFWMHLTLGFCSSPLRFLVTTGPCVAAPDLTFKGTVEIQHRSIPLPACLLSVLKPQRDTAPKGGWGGGLQTGWPGGEKGAHDPLRLLMPPHLKNMEQVKFRSLLLVYKKQVCEFGWEADCRGRSLRHRSPDSLHVWGRGDTLFDKGVM